MAPIELRRRTRRAGASLLALGLILTVLGLMPAPAGATHVTPVEYSGNPDCKSLSASYSELKIDSSELASDESYTDGTITVTITNLDEAEQQFDWSSDLDVDVVLVKGGDGGNRYDYPGASDFSDTGLETATNAGNDENPVQPAISHLSFCYDGTSTPTTETPTTETPTTETPTTETPTTETPTTLAPTTTPTTAPPTTTVTPTTPTTIGDLAVLGLVIQPTTTTTAAPGVSVLGVQQTRALARTGTETRPVLLVAGFLLAMGGAALLAARPQPVPAGAGPGISHASVARLLTLARMALAIQDDDSRHRRR